MAERKPSESLPKTILSHAALISLSIVFLIPFVWLLTSSLKSETHLFTFPPEWIPRGEYLYLGDGVGSDPVDEGVDSETEYRGWAEVVRQEVVEYAPIQYDDEGKAMERKPLRTKVTLVNRLGAPLQAPVATIDVPEPVSDLDKGIFNPKLLDALRASEVDLPDKPVLKLVTPGREWRIPQRREGELILNRHGDQLKITTDDPSRRIVDFESIETKAWPTFRHYVKGVKGFSFALFLQNTLFIAALTVLGSVLSCSWVAFGFSVIEWPGRDKIFYLMLATLMLPPQVTMIPLFLIFKSLGWINTYLPLIVPQFLGNAFFIFLLRQFFLTIPKDLIDAARIDGCSTFRIYWQIVMPLSIPALATVALFTFMISWNDFMGPLIYVVDEAKYTLSLGLAMFKGRFASRYGEMMAVSVLLTLPIIVLFFFTQKTFIQGIKTSGMKG